MLFSSNYVFDCSQIKIQVKQFYNEFHYFQATYIATQLIDSKPESVPEATDPTTTSKKHSGQSANDPTTISYTLSAEYLATEPLDRALDIWSDLMVDRCNTSMFNDPVSTCYCLKVAASLCHFADMVRDHS